MIYRKYSKSICTALSVLSPGQEEELWSTLREERLVNKDSAGATRRRSLIRNLG